MTKSLVTSKQYSKIQKAIAEELTSGAERVRRSYRLEVVQTSWNIGKILRGEMGLEDQPSSANAALIAQLSRDLERPESFFYDTAKFHRLYPEKAPTELTWSHYCLLIRLKDPRQRRALERKAITDAINAKDFRVYTQLPYAESHPLPGFEYLQDKKRTVLAVKRGRLYYYHTTKAPRDGRILIDIGFGIEREVRFDPTKPRHGGLILRTVRQTQRHSDRASRDSGTNAGKNLTLLTTRSLPAGRQASLSTEFRMTTKNIHPTGEDYVTKLSPFDKNRLYTYAATLVRVIDGDTIIARIDLGFRTHKTETFRLRGIDAPEVTCALGQKAKAWVTARLKPCAYLVIKSYKQEKFGRYLADVFYEKEAGEDRERILKEGAFLNQQLLDEGLATPYYEQ